ncbi:MAG: pitrilysin family protein, partial [Candidatus Acidiferrales bacterium]
VSGSAQQSAPVTPAASAAPAPTAQLAPDMPPLAPPHPFVFPKVATKTFPNGLRVFVASDSDPAHAQPSVSIELLLPSAGTSGDPAGKPGVASMTASLLTEGTDKRSAQDIASAIDFVGGSLEASASEDCTTIEATVVKKDFDEAMDLLSDVTLHANFSAQELERRREQALSDLSMSYDDTEYLASATFRRVVFGGNPYGLPGEGTPETVRGLTRNDIVAFRDGHYFPKGALLAFAGAITPEEAFAATEKYLGSWTTTGAVAMSNAASITEPTSVTGASGAARPNGLRIYLVQKPDAVQTQIRIGRPGMARGNPDYLAMQVANQIFGGSYNARLNTAVRLKKGLTYDASSGFPSYRTAGDIQVTTFTRTDETVPATQLVLDELRKMSSGEVTPEELGVARDFLAGVFPLHAETPSDVADRVLGAAFYGLPADYLETYQERIRAVTAADVKRVSQKYFDPQDLDVVFVGNVAGFRDAIAKMLPGATIVEIPAENVDLLSPTLQRAQTQSPAGAPANAAGPGAAPHN